MISADSTALRRRQGALSSIRVVEFGHYLPGPLTGMLLADQGAQVVKVEPPWGDPARSHNAFGIWNRGKRSVVVDLRTEAGCEHARSLVNGADVVVENFRPGVAARLGIGPETLTAGRPDLIYCSLPGFGPGHPLRTEAGWEPIVGAASALFPEPDGGEPGTPPGPHFSPVPVASTFAAMLATVSISMALVERGRSGRGQRIEVPLHDAVFTAMGRFLLDFGGVDGFDDPELFQWPRHVMARQYATADGRWIQHHGMWKRFLRQTLHAADREEWLPEAEACFERKVTSGVLDHWVSRFGRLFRSQSGMEWEDRISAAGGACTLTRTFDEWVAHPHATQAGLVVHERTVGTASGDVTHRPGPQPGIQVNLRRTPGYLGNPAPSLGAHTDCPWEPAGSVPVSPASDRALMSSPAALPLAGVRVLDLCIVLAGPSCGRTLAEFGADVIRIDDPSRRADPVMSIDVNRGKRSIVLDLKSAEGRAHLWRLLETADVLLENFRLGALTSLGLDYESVSERRPEIVYASMNCFGHEGPWRGRPGWEQSAQAATGIQLRHGGRDAEPRLLPYPVTDYGTGLMAAYGVALAMAERRTSGRGQHVQTSLAATAGLLQSPFFPRMGSDVSSTPEGVSALGWSAASRLYLTADGWIYVHCADATAWRRLLELIEPSGAASGHPDPPNVARDDEPLQQALSAVFSTRPANEWIPVLARLGIASARNTSLLECRDSDYARRSGLVVRRPHPGRGVITQLGTTVRYADPPLRLGEPAPEPGAHTAEVLAEVERTAYERRSRQSIRLR